MADDESLPWGTTQCAGKLVGHRLLDWSFYALILVFPVIWYFIFGSWFKSQLGSLVSGVSGRFRDSQYFPLCGWVPISRKKNRCSHGSLVSRVSGRFRDSQYFPLCGWVPISREKKRCSHCKHRTRAKAKDRVRRWRRRALPVALVVCCQRKSIIPGSQNIRNMNILYKLFKNKAPCLAFNISEPVHWEWKKEEGWFVFHHVGIEALYPSRFLCGGS